MRQVFVNEDHARVGFYKSVLEEAGIPSFIRNDYSNNSVAGMPSPLFFPALCVVRDDDYARALQVLREVAYQPATRSEDCNSPKRAEHVPGTFDSCWHCGAFRSDLAPPESAPENT